MERAIFFLFPALWPQQCNSIKFVTGIKLQRDYGDNSLSTTCWSRCGNSSVFCQRAQHCTISRVCVVVVMTHVSFLCLFLVPFTKVLCCVTFTTLYGLRERLFCLWMRHFPWEVFVLWRPGLPWFYWKNGVCPRLLPRTVPSGSQSCVTDFSASFFKFCACVLVNSSASGFDWGKKKLAVCLWLGLIP